MLSNTSSNIIACLTQNTWSNESVHKHDFMILFLDTTRNEIQIQNFLQILFSDFFNFLLSIFKNYGHFTDDFMNWSKIVEIWNLHVGLGLEFLKSAVWWWVLSWVSFQPDETRTKITKLKGQLKLRGSYKCL